MSQVIVLNDEQAEVLALARGLVEVRDQMGRFLGLARLNEPAADHGVTKEGIAVALRRKASDGPLDPTREGLDHGASLDQRDGDLS
jgi:hypothetical protein